MTTKTELAVGDRVNLVRDVERFPHFIAKAGNTGTVVWCRDGRLEVEFDQPIEGCEEWDNIVQWDEEWADRVADDLAKAGRS
jgi:hypothetical protein